MEKRKIIEMARKYVCPGKIDAFGRIGIDLVIGKREGPYIFDTDDMHTIAPRSDSAHEKIMLSRDLLYEFEKR